MSPKAKSLPVLMYHYISDYPDKLAIPPALFEEHCRVMAENGWFGVGLAEAEEFFLRGADLPPKSFLITLDDGYLDNYVYAWPILEKYGHKGVIFPVADEITAATEAADPASPLRPTLADVWSGKARPEDLPCVDEPVIDRGLGFPVRRDLFFNWHEARAMEKSGVVGLGGHSLRHAGVFIGPEYRGFYQPGGRTTPFARPVDGMIWGMPSFPREAEFISRAFLPNPDMVAAIAVLVPQEEEGAHRFFADQAKVRELEALVKSYDGKLGRLETEDEREGRLSGLFAANQRIMRQELGRDVRSFCWPWGLSSPASLKAAQENGFSIFFNVEPGPNPPGRAVGIRRLNAKRDTRKALNRLRIYSRPILGALYKKMRI